MLQPRLGSTILVHKQEGRRRASTGSCAPSFVLGSPLIPLDGERGDLFNRYVPLPRQTFPLERLQACGVVTNFAVLAVLLFRSAKEGCPWTKCESKLLRFVWLHATCMGLPLAPRD